MDWVDGDSATLTMNDNDMTRHLRSLGCPMSVQVQRPCKEPLVIEGCMIREDEDGFYIEYPDEYAERIAAWWGREG